MWPKSGVWEQKKFENKNFSTVLQNLQFKFWMCSILKWKSKIFVCSHNLHEFVTHSFVITILILYVIPQMNISSCHSPFTFLSKRSYSEQVILPKRCCELCHHFSCEINNVYEEIYQTNYRKLFIGVSTVESKSMKMRHSKRLKIV